MEQLNDDEIKKHDFEGEKNEKKSSNTHSGEIYLWNDFQLLLNFKPFNSEFPVTNLKTLDELVEKDKQREKDGFPKRIRFGKVVKPLSGNKAKVVVVPTTTEPKFYHDDSITEDEEETTGGSGKGEEGEIIGKQYADPHQGEGSGEGAGQGDSEDHDIAADAQELGKILTEEFHLPNLKNKGNKHSLKKYTYTLTDRNREFGQLLDKKETLKSIIKTNIVLDNINPDDFFDPSNLVINPKDKIYRIMSKEKDFEAQAVVFFVRDYSGSMSGKPAEIVVSQHLMIYSWLMYQYQSNVLTKFIVHDTEAKVVPDFYTYYRYQVAGGTYVFPAFELLNKIIETEQLQKDYNIYVFYGTDGDDWENDGKKMLDELRKTLVYSSRCGITIAKNSWAKGQKTVVEKYIESSGLLTDKKEFFKMDTLEAEKATDDEIIKSIKKLIQ